MREVWRLALCAGALAACSELAVLPRVGRVQLTVTPTRLAVGQAAVLVGIAYDASGRRLTHARRLATFRSADPSIATVCGAGTGEVHGVGMGRVFVFAESGGVRDSVQVTVTAPP